MLFKGGELMWMVPTRYWEDTEPTQVRVVGDQRIEVHPVCQFNTSSLLVDSMTFGHTVYVNPNDVLYDKEIAIGIAKARASIYYLRQKDHDAVAIDRHLKDIGIE
jgi:hypothetical protein